MAEADPGRDNEGHDDDDESTGLLDREKEEEDERRRWQEKHSPLGERYEMKHREPRLPHWWEKGYKFPDISSTTKTSTSGKQETSFMGGDTDGRDVLEKRIRDREELEGDIHEVFPNINKGLLPHIRRDDYNRLVVNLGKTNSRDWVIASDGRPSNDIGLAKFPKGLRSGLGKTNEQINQEAYEVQKKEEERQAKREQEQEQARRAKAENEEKLRDAEEREENLEKVVKEQEEAKKYALSTEDKESHTRSAEASRNALRQVSTEVDGFRAERDRLEQAERNADTQVEEGERQVETARERVNERLLSLRDRIK